MPITIKDGNSVNKQFLSALLDEDNLLINSSIPFELMAAAGKITGVTREHKFGESAVITTVTDPQDIWLNGGTMTYSTLADITTISSSSVLDTQTIKMYGLDVNGIEIVQNVTLQGTTPVSLSSPLRRINRMKNIGASDLAGVVYCYVGTTQTGGIPDNATDIRATINGSVNQTLQTHYTVPRGKVAFITALRTGLEFVGGGPPTSGAAVRGYLNIREDGGVFQAKEPIALSSNGSSYVQETRKSFEVVPAKSDIKLTVSEVSADVKVVACYDMYIVDEELLDNSFLISIGQPS